MSCKISLIIPVYNVEKYLRQCLESVAAQTFKDFEAIIIDNNSPDNSAQIIREFVEKYPHFKTYKLIGGGIGGARNEGLKHACGEYIVFLDSDDWLDSTILEKLYKAAAENQADIAGCTFYRTDVLGKIKERSHAAGKKPFVLDAEKDGQLQMLKVGLSVGQAWCKAIKRDIIASNRLLFPENTPYEDVAFVAVCFALANKYVYVNEPLLYYRHVSTSISNTKSELAPKSLFNNFAAMRKILEEKGLYKEDLAEEWEYRYLHMTIGGEGAGNGGLKNLSKARLEEFFALSKDFYLNMPADFFKKRNMLFRLKFNCFKMALRHNWYSLHKYTRLPINILSAIYGVFAK